MNKWDKSICGIFLNKFKKTKQYFLISFQKASLEHNFDFRDVSVVVNLNCLDFPTSELFFVAKTWSTHSADLRNVLFYFLDGTNKNVHLT